MNETELLYSVFINGITIKIPREDLCKYAYDYHLAPVICPDGERDFLSFSHYILREDHSIEEVFLLHEWGKWLESMNPATRDTVRRVASTRIDNVHVSTVFLGLDHNFMNHGKHKVSPPVLFETMVFVDLPEPKTVDVEFGESSYSYTKTRDEFDGEGFMDRYCIYDEAVSGHNEISDRVRASLEAKKLMIQSAGQHV